MRERYLEGVEHDRFIEFARGILQWLPEDRPTAIQIVESDYLMELHRTSAESKLE